MGIREVRKNGIEVVSKKPGLILCPDDKLKVSGYIGSKIEGLQEKINFAKIEEKERDFLRGQLRALIDIEKAVGVVKIERRALWVK